MIFNVTIEVPSEIDIVHKLENFEDVQELKIILEYVFYEKHLHSSIFAKTFFWNLITIIFVKTSSPSLKEPSSFLEA